MKLLLAIPDVRSLTKTFNNIHDHILCFERIVRLETRVPSALEDDAMSSKYDFGLMLAQRAFPLDDYLEQLLDESYPYWVPEQKRLPYRRYLEGLGGLQQNSLVNRCA